jgi:hypothetical protein
VSAVADHYSISKLQKKGRYWLEDTELKKVTLDVQINVILYENQVFFHKNGSVIDLLISEVPVESSCDP